MQFDRKHFLEKRIGAGFYNTAEGNSVRLVNAKRGRLKDYTVFGNTRIGLPPGYQAVTYLKNSSDAPYINTGLAATSDLTIEADWKIGAGGGSATYGIIFTRNTSMNVNAGIHIGVRRQQNGSVVTYNIYGRFEGAYNRGIGDFDMAEDVSGWNRCVCRIGKNGFYAGDVLLDGRTVSPFNLGCDLYLFSQNNNGTVSKLYGNSILYSCKIWKNDILVRHFVPCYRKSDNAPGLYDLAEERFYQKEGSGTLTAGEAANSEAAAGVGELVTEGEYAGKYKIPITAEYENGTRKTVNIYRDAPLFEGESISFGEDALPEIMLHSGINTITVDTSVPATISAVYRGSMKLR